MNTFQAVVWLGIGIGWALWAMRMDYIMSQYRRWNTRKELMRRNDSN